MTLEEYCLKASKRVPAFSVEIRRSDCISVWKVHTGTLVHLRMFNSVYLVPNNGKGGMWTIDEHGNKKKASVFKFVDYDENKIPTTDASSS